ARITVATDCGVYFCDTHSPWQRPTNENTNGLVRDYFPKGTRFDESVSDDDVQAMQAQLNRRPRQGRADSTPAEVLAGLVLADVDWLHPPRCTSTPRPPGGRYATTPTGCRTGCLPGRRG